MSRFSAEARGDGSGRHQALDAGGAGAAAAGERLRGAAARADRARHARGRHHRGRQRLRRRLPGRPLAPTYLGATACATAFPIWSTRRDAVLLRAGHRHARGRAGVLSPAPRAEFAGCRSRCGSRRCPSTTAAGAHGALRRDRSRRRLVRLPLRRRGTRLPQPRERFPSFTLFVKWRGERVPLVRWRTTVGGWRSELASDGQEYYRYKGSDVGPRVWRHIVAAPVWIPPAVVAARLDGEGEAGQRRVRERHQLRRDGARLPVGLRPGGGHPRGDAARPRRAELLRQRHPHARLVRLHVAARALLARLPSPLQQPGGAAVQLRARAPEDRVVGSIALGFRRTFWSKGEVFEMRLPSRGFYYELDPPLPVESLEGRVKGTRQKPIAGYLPKPGVKYASSEDPDGVDLAREPRRRRRAMTRGDAALPPTLALARSPSRCWPRRGRPARRTGSAPQPARSRGAARASDAGRPGPRSAALRRGARAGRDRRPARRPPGDDQAARRRQPQGARLLGAQGSGRRAAGDPATARHGPARPAVRGAGFLPLHTRAFTDHDETLSVRLYDEEAASGLLGHPIR